MIFKKSILLSSVAFLAVSMTTACSKDDDDKGEAPVALTPTPTPAPGVRFDLTETVSNDSRFSTLKAALVAAGLDTVLKQGEYTILAPTNEAFAKIPKEQLDALLADKAALTNVLLYHVVAGKFLAADVLKNTELTTASQLKLKVSTDAAGAYINSSKITATDIVTSNGIIHAIDTVLLPSE